MAVFIYLCYNWLVHTPAGIIRTFWSKALESLMRKAILFFISLFLLGGCSSLKDPQARLNDVARIWINQTAALEVLEAAVAENELYIHFNSYWNDSDEYETFYAYANWDPTESPDINLSKNIVVPLKIIDEQRWQGRPQQLKSILALPAQHWHDFRFDLAHALTPQEANQGTVIRSNEDELILFYDDDEHLQVMALKDKPAHVQIAQTLTQQELAFKMVETMKGYLAKQSIEAEQILLAVANDDDYTNPFLYIDIANRVAFHLKLPVGNEAKYRQGLLKKGVKSADYLLFDSYVLGMWKRPVSSSLRLFSWAQSTTRDVIKPPSLAAFDNTPPPPLYKGEGMDLKAFEDKLNKTLGTRTSHGAMDFLIDGDEFFTRLTDAIIAAKKSIDVRIFIFDNDDYAVSIADLLKKRSKEGVKVRVLLDGMGQVMGEGKVPEDLPQGFTPPSSMESYLRKGSNIQVRVRPNAWFKADHTKTIIIDEELFFTGGMNIGREYRYHWHDMMMEVRGPVLAEIMKEFEIAWAHAGAWGDLGYLQSVFNKLAVNRGHEGHPPLRTLYTRLNDPQIYKAQLLAIKEAKRYIYVHNSYLSDDTIIYELIKARRRGVDVRVILPIHGNHNIMNANNVVSANTMFRSGIRVFFYPGMSHIKAAVYDGWLCTGSANFDKLSLVDNLELNLATSDSKTVESILESLFEADFKESKEMTEPLDQGWKERLAEFLAEHL